MSDADGEPPQIRILAEGLACAIPTALVAFTASEGFAVCDRLNPALGLNRDAWTALAARRLHAGSSGSGALH